MGDDVHLDSDADRQPTGPHAVEPRSVDPTPTRPEQGTDDRAATEREFDAFWARASAAVSGLIGREDAQAWSFGASQEQADELLALVLDGVKTATASAVWDYEADDEALPSAGLLNIVLDGRGVARALIETTNVTVRPFNEVGAQHASAEGEGDRTLAYWRRAHEQFWRKHMTDERGFAPDMPIVCESFRLLYSE